MYLRNIIVVWLLSLTTLVAQENNWQQKYLHAKSFFNEGQFALAMESFKPLVEDVPGNDFATYSSFYYALSAYNTNYIPLAKSMMLQIKSKYPSWSKIDEVNYWLGLIYLKENSFNQGLNVLAEIKDKKLEEDVEALKFNYFENIESLRELKELYSNHENEKTLAYLLAKRISRETLVNQDQKQLRELIEKFDFDPTEFNVIEVQKTIYKEEYKVAVLLPFMSNDLEPNLRRKVNQFVLDMYQGIELAADTLKKQGVNIKLHAYDTKRSKRVTQEIVEKEELKGMDLIIGPLYTDPIAVVNDFAYKNKINVVNPLSSNAGVIGNNPFAYLFFPSNETIGRTSAEFVVNNVKKKPGIVLYEDNPNDSAAAYAFKDRIKVDSFKIIQTRRISKENTRQILDMLLIPGSKLRDASSEEAKEEYGIKLDSISFIFVASGNDLISSKVLSAVETRGDSITVIGSADWLNLPVIKYETYSKLGCVLYAPNYFKKDTPTYKSFRSQYIKRHKEIPGKYAEIGYELMLLMGNGLKEHGKYFQLGWRDKGYAKGYLTSGFNFNNSNDNLVMPLLKFNNNEIQVELINDDK